jgi:hypothetical protein
MTFGMSAGVGRKSARSFKSSCVRASIASARFAASTEGTRPSRSGQPWVPWCSRQPPWSSPPTGCRIYRRNATTYQGGAGQKPPRERPAGGDGPRPDLLPESATQAKEASLLTTLALADPLAGFKIAEAMVPSTARAVSGSTDETQPASSSIQWSRRTEPIAANVLRTGKIHMEFLT